MHPVLPSVVRMLAFDKQLTQMKLSLQKQALHATPSVETGGILVPRVFVLMTDHEGEGSGVENKLSGRQNLVLFAGKKAWCREVVTKFASEATMLR